MVKGAIVRNKELYLHIGGQKTGSTAFQHYVKSNAYLLETQGTLYLDPGSIVEGLETSLLWQDIDLEEFGKTLNRRIQDSELNTFLLSSELLCHLNVEQLVSITRHLKDVVISWIYVHREPSQVLLSHWADRVTLFGDGLDFADYVPIRIKSPFIPGRQPLFETVRSGDLDLLVIATKLKGFPGIKNLFTYSPDVVFDLIKFINPAHEINTEQSHERIHISPGIATTYLCIEYLGLAFRLLGARLPYKAFIGASRLIRDVLSPFDLSVKTSQINVKSSLLQDYPFLVPDLSRLRKEFNWNLLSSQYIRKDESDRERSNVDYRNLKNTFTKEIGELRGKINEQELIELAIAELRPYATEN